MTIWANLCGFGTLMSDNVSAVDDWVEQITGGHVTEVKIVLTAIVVALALSSVPHGGWIRES